MTRGFASDIFDVVFAEIPPGVLVHSISFNSAPPFVNSKAVILTSELLPVFLSTDGAFVITGFAVLSAKR